eukprot:752218-Hanusia_phi.AAC.3
MQPDVCLRLLMAGDSLEQQETDSKQERGQNEIPTVERCHFHWVGGAKDEELWQRGRTEGLEEARVRGRGPGIESEAKVIATQTKTQASQYAMSLHIYLRFMALRCLPCKEPSPFYLVSLLTGIAASFQTSKSQ